MGRTTLAKQPLCGSPWVLNYPCCYQMITQNHSRGDRRVSEKVDFSKYFKCH